MELEEARELLRKSQGDRKGARESLKMAQATIESSQLIIQGVLKRFPELAEEEKEFEDQWELEESVEQPRGADAVLSILQVDEERPFSVQAMTNELERRGWLPESSNPPNAVRTALERLVALKGSNVEKGRSPGGTVTYRYIEPPKLEGYGYSEEPF